MHQARYASSEVLLYVHKSSPSSESFAFPSHSSIFFSLVSSASWLSPVPSLCASSLLTTFASFTICMKCALSFAVRCKGIIMFAPRYCAKIPGCAWSVRAWTEIILRRFLSNTISCLTQCFPSPTLRFSLPTFAFEAKKTDAWSIKDYWRGYVRITTFEMLSLVISVFKQPTIKRMEGISPSFAQTRKCIYLSGKHHFPEDSSPDAKVDQAGNWAWTRVYDQLRSGCMFAPFLQQPSTRVSTPRRIHSLTEIASSHYFVHASFLLYFKWNRRITKWKSAAWWEFAKAALNYQTELSEVDIRE